ncbi:sulfurtransferase [Aliidiomarina minuta]|uniref:Sulfurtransferase n=1 Tax=Aliidiomarina minuta TaxID=880057 RepID=A0A432W7L6_9GAMM|nr:rhodanese-like domain-containing protein [Aliidiomarina minuta]RUO26083.1 sulfurtransferase [Aliidiomarina minuta]
MKTVQQLVAEVKQRIQEVSTDDLAQLDNNDALIIDVREPAEYAEGHIAEAINLPRGVLEFQLSSHPAVAASGCAPEVALQQLQDRPLYLICRSGGRSALAAAALQDMGLNKVFSVSGGMQAWKQENKNVTG